MVLNSTSQIINLYTNNSLKAITKIKEIVFNLSNESTIEARQSAMVEFKNNFDILLFEFHELLRLLDDQSSIEYTSHYNDWIICDDPLDNNDSWEKYLLLIELRVRDYAIRINKEKQNLAIKVFNIELLPV